MPKVNFKITPYVEQKIEKALRKYGNYEIGGVLIGKKIKSKTFEIIDISVSDEDKEFSFISFFRGVKKTDSLLRKHYKQKSGYYIGEWHSHPKFSLTPSHQDIVTMERILEDENYGVTFTILLITKLNNDTLDYKGYFFHKNIDKMITLDCNTSSDT